MQIKNFNPSQVLSRESFSHGRETKKGNLEVLKQNIPYNDSLPRTITKNLDFVISCKDSFMARNKIVNTG